MSTISPRAAQQLRLQMPVSQRFAYFDHAAVGPLPQKTASAIANYAREASEQGDVPWLSWAARVSQLREAASQLIHCGSEEIALVGNTTQGIHIVAEGFPWKSGDNVVVPANEFPSNLLPWKYLERYGVEARTVPIPASGEIDLTQLEQAIDSRTRILAVSWVGFLSGYRSDPAELADLAHRHGALLMLDAIQGVGAFPIDVKGAGVDFLCADGHKWMLGPEGAGFMYIDSKHLNLLHDVGVGWNSLSVGAFDPTSAQLKTTAAKFEGGTNNMPGMLGLRESLEILLDAGASAPENSLQASILENVSAIEQLASSAGLHCHLPGDAKHRSGIVGISWQEASEIGDVAYSKARKHCLEKDIVMSVRGGRLRIATHAYNNIEDIERLITGLTEARELLTRELL